MFLLLAALIAAPAAQQQYSLGVFVGTAEGPVQLTAYAEPTRSGELRMAKETLREVPNVGDVTRLLSNVPNWKPSAVFVASEEIFRSDRAERRQLPFAVRFVNVSAVEMRVEDLEGHGRLEQLRRSVRASDTLPAYVFIVLTSGGLERYYAFRLVLD